MSIIAIVNITARSGKSEEALKVIKKSQDYCLSLEICTGFEVFKSQTDIHKFSFVERWNSMENHKDFLSELMNNDEFVASLDVFTSGPKIEYFRIV